MLESLSLNGEWNLFGKAIPETLKVVVPGCVHLDLLEAGVIEDPYVGEKEIDVQWVGEADWTYERHFTIPGGFLKRKHVLMRCHGLDTFAEIRLNGKRLAKTDNAFRTWEFDARKHLFPGKNTIAIAFKSPIPYARRLSLKNNDREWGESVQIPGFCYVRKSACNWGWDWGPKLLTCGIWRGIELVAFDEARFEDIAIRQVHAKKSVQLELDVRSAYHSTRPIRLVAVLGRHGRPVAGTEVPVRRGHARAVLEIPEPELWWPNGLGEQPLYDLRLELRNGDGVPIEIATRRLGLRTIRLVCEKDQWGESFHFEVNGVAFFAKGANWIPADTFVADLAAEDYRPLLESATAAHMNMLRVWGGGIYEHDCFYDLCDELGLLVWQDFMFACSTYPTYDDVFMASVAAEARDNVRRIRHHACLALWCGNNEIEQGFVADEWGGGKMSWEDYGKLFDKLLPAIVKELDPETAYWPCSPHTPHGDRGDWNDPTCGDAHLWDVWHARKPFEWYRTTTHRFCSEFGFQSFPEPRTVAAYAEPEERNITSAVMEHHQRSGVGNSVIMDYTLSWFRMPTGFESTLRLSQIVQGNAMRYAIEHWRRNRPRSMGALYWQLNDCWPVASWASLDYYGRWKALHHMARRFFAPLLISGVEDPAKGTVEVHVSNDSMERFDGEVVWRATRASDGKRIAHGKQIVRVASQSTRRATVLRLKEVLASTGTRDLLVWLELRSGRKTISTNLVHFARPKHLEIRDPKLKLDVKKLPGGFALRITAASPSLWVWFEYPGPGEVHFDDNFFHLAAGEKRTVVVRTEAEVPVTKFRQALRFGSLFDTYS